MRPVEIKCIDCGVGKMIDADKKNIAKYAMEHPRCKSCSGLFHPNKGHFEKGQLSWMKGRAGLRLSPKTEFIHGHKPWNTGLKGIHLSPQTEFTSESVSNEKHPYWKGDNVGYAGIHKWVNRHKGKANHCEHCGATNGKFEWANKSHEYKRDLGDWLSLCKKCHVAYDKNHWGIASRKYKLA